MLLARIRLCKSGALVGWGCRAAVGNWGGGRERKSEFGYRQGDTPWYFLVTVVFLSELSETTVSAIFPSQLLFVLSTRSPSCTFGTRPVKVSCLTLTFLPSIRTIYRKRKSINNKSGVSSQTVNMVINFPSVWLYLYCTALQLDCESTVLYVETIYNNNNNNNNK